MPETVELAPYIGRSCHYGGCDEPVVCSSVRAIGGYVCREHNDYEWALALRRDPYWSKVLPLREAVGS